MKNKSLMIISSVFALTAFVLFVIFAYNFMFKDNMIEKAKAEGKIIALGIDENYDMATIKAIKNAIRQSSSIHIKQDGLINDFDIKLTESNSISAYVNHFNIKYSGMIKSYNILSTKEKNDKFYVTIAAEINIPENIAEYKSPNLEKGDIPTLAITKFKGSKYISCGNSEVKRCRINKALKYSLKSLLNSTKKFKIVQRDHLEEYDNEMAIIQSGFTKNSDKSKLKNVFSADYILTGDIVSIKVDDLSERIEMTGEFYPKSKYSISVNYSLMELATTQVISSNTVNYSYIVEEEPKDCTLSLRNLTKHASKKMVNDIMFDIFGKDKSLSKIIKQHNHKQKVKIKEHYSNGHQKKQVVKLPFDK